MSVDQRAKQAKFIQKNYDLKLVDCNGPFKHCYYDIGFLGSVYKAVKLTYFNDVICDITNLKDYPIEFYVKDIKFGGF